MRPRDRCSLSLVMVGLLAGCAVGPDFTPPPPPPPTALGGGLMPSGSDSMGAAWWHVYQSPRLDALVARALANNADLAAAEAALRAAAETRRSGIGQFLPAIDAGFSATRQKDPTGSVSSTSATGNPYLTLLTPQLSLSYAIDLSGGLRRTQEGLEAAEESQRFQTEAVRMTLVNSVITTAIGLSATRQEIAEAERLIATQEEWVAIDQRLLSTGQIAPTDLMAQQAQLAQFQELLPPLQQQAAQQAHQLAALLGQYPGDSLDFQAPLSEFAFPSELPAAIPAKLVEQRPDIRIAQADLQAASAALGVAIANRLPSIAVTAADGSSATRWSNLLNPGTGFWSIGAGLTEPLFDGMSLMYKERAARESLQQATDGYRSVVVTAMENVADSLAALEHDAASVAAAQAGSQRDDQSLSVLQRQESLGDCPHTAVLQAEQTAAQARITLLVAQSNRLSDVAALFQALGGGWWSSPDGIVQSHE